MKDEYDLRDLITMAHQHEGPVAALAVDLLVAAQTLLMHGEPFESAACVLMTLAGSLFEGTTAELADLTTVFCMKHLADAGTDPRTGQPLPDVGLEAGLAAQLRSILGEED